jgi:putative transposase
VKKKRFTEEQIIGFLREADAGLAVKELCRKHGFSEASYYTWRNKFGGMDVSDAKRLKALEAENTRLKKLLAEAMLENEVTREALRKKW